MIRRQLEQSLRSALARAPVAALLGPRQVGKTTLAIDLAARLDDNHVYLDLERDSDRAKLADAELFLGGQRGRLVVLDEVQRMPQLFQLLRSLVDERLRAGEPSGHFLVLGSASRDLLHQSSESLAGRIEFLELRPLVWSEVGARDADVEALWLRGGFPRSYLATDDAASWVWRTHFISTYLERDIPQLGPRLPAEQMRRLWTMLGHGQGDPLNAAKLGAGLGVSGNTVRNYLDVLTDLYMVRQLAPWSGNSRKRLVRSPKVYVRDSGLLHRLVNVPDVDTLLGHPVCGGSWEGFVVENVLALVPDTWTPTYYRTSAQAEIDLVLEGPGDRTVAIEIKRTLSPKVSKGFRLAAEDVGATARFYVMPSGDRYPLERGIEAIGLAELLAWVRTELWWS